MFSVFISNGRWMAPVVDPNLKSEHSTIKSKFMVFPGGWKPLNSMLTISFLGNSAVSSILKALQAKEVVMVSVAH